MRGAHAKRWKEELILLETGYYLSFHSETVEPLWWLRNRLRVEEARGGFIGTPAACWVGGSKLKTREV